MPRQHVSLPAGYGRLWSAATVSALGDGLRVAAIPLLATSVTGDPLAISIVSAAGFLPWPVLGLLGGAIADRFDRRRSMWMVNAVRALLMTAAMVSLLVEGSLPIAALAALAFLLGSAETVYDNATIGYLPQLLPAESLAVGNARLMTSQLSGTQLIGPPIGGLLFAIAAAVPLALDAASFAIAAALITSLPRSDRPTRSPSKDLRTDIAEGLRWLWTSSTLRAMAVLTTVLSAVSGALLAMLVVYAHHQLHVSSIGYGLMLGAFAAGSMAGALSAPRLMRDRSLGHVLAGSVVVTPVVFAGLAVAPTTAVAALLLAVLGTAVGTWNVASVTTRQRIVPGRLLGRVNSVYRASALTFTTIGALSAGLLTAATSVTTTLWGCAVLVALGLALGARGLNRLGR
ncbi:MAG TPA: MFS transporter [Lacisediminihabitans sp.]|uniref:MFS transporter n=1 Tax=Lacisediminihabitans sp. TaxID=2787631 RepID=UPI002ED8E7D5